MQPGQPACACMPSGAPALDQSKEEPIDASATQRRRTGRTPCERQHGLPSTSTSCIPLADGKFQAATSSKTGGAGPTTNGAGPTATGGEASGRTAAKPAPSVLRMQVTAYTVPEAVCVGVVFADVGENLAPFLSEAALTPVPPGTGLRLRLLQAVRFCMCVVPRP